MPPKPLTRWRMQILLAMTIMLLAATGLFLWWLPGGGADRALRHLLRWIHEGTAIAFLLLVAAHLYDRWEGIRRNLRRFGFWGRP